ncbi:MAG: TolC family protein [Mediterranea sp.]|jgi:outer membrane protein|nr:TolC family protein [Mediterranea sp.]
MKKMFDGRRAGIVLAITLALVGWPVGRAQEPWTLEHCIRYALAHNIQVKRQANQIGKLEEQRRSFKNGYLPSVSLRGDDKFDFGRALNSANTYYNVSKTQTANFQLSAQMPLFTGFKLSSSIAQGKFDILAAQENKAVIENNLSLDICTDYFQILLDKEIYRIAMEQIDLTREQIERTHHLVDHGKAPESQLLDVQAQLADDELAATQARNSLRMSVVNLSQLLELEGVETFDVVPVRDTLLVDAIDTPAEIYRAALLHLPQIKQAGYEIESSRRAVKVARSGYYPTVSLTIGANTDYYHYYSKEITNQRFAKQFAGNLQKYVGFTVSVPLFDGLATRSKVRMARRDQENASLGLDNAKKELYKQIETAYTDAVAAREKYRSTTRSVAANKEAHRYALEKYAAGKSSVYEYNESRMKLANARSGQAQAKYTYLLKMKILAFYRGIPLLDTLHGQI